MVAEIRRSYLKLALIASACSGCASGYRVWAGPTMDTDGRLGGVVGVAVEAGFADGSRSAIVQELGVALGARSEPGAFTSSSTLGYSHLSYLGGAVMRVTARTHFDAEVREGWSGETTAGPGLAFAAGPVIATQRETWWALSLEASGRLVAPISDEDAPIRGRFGGVVVFSKRTLARWSEHDCNRPHLRR